MFKGATTTTKRRERKLTQDEIKLGNKKQILALRPTKNKKSWARDGAHGGKIGCYNRGSSPSARGFNCSPRIAVDFARRWLESVEGYNRELFYRRQPHV